MIVLPSGEAVSAEEIEAHYLRSAFIKEICVFRPGDLDGDGLFAVVVPDLDRLRAKRIVNAGDLIRFEMEGLTSELAVHRRVSGYEISFEALPRTTTDAIDRREIERRSRERQEIAAGQRDAPTSAADDEWIAQPDSAAVLAIITERLRSDARVGPDANLEIDLGLDSMDRVELLTELERRSGLKVSQQAAAEIFTVRQLVKAFSAGDVAASRPASVVRSWADLLKDLPPPGDPMVRGLVANRPIAAPLMHLLARIIRALLFRIELTGLENLPGSGAYIISPNHQSYLDPFMLCASVPFAIYRKLFFVGAVEYFETPLTQWFARLANLVPVDPDSNLVPAMKAGAFGLAHGKVLVLFPEGERAIDGTVKKFKKGAPILAQHLRVPIVPVAIKGAFELWPRGRNFNWRLLKPWSRHRVTIAIGTPMSFAEAADYNQAAIELRDRVEKMWQSL
jgi:long-chain acyl-CoA synthetase